MLEPSKLQNIICCQQFLTGRFCAMHSTRKYAIGFGRLCSPCARRQDLRCYQITAVDLAFQKSSVSVCGLEVGDCNVWEHSCENIRKSLEHAQVHKGHDTKSTNLSSGFCMRLRCLRDVRWLLSTHSQHKLQEMSPSSVIENQDPVPDTTTNGADVVAEYTTAAGSVCASDTTTVGGIEACAQSR